MQSFEFHRLQTNEDFGFSKEFALPPDYISDRFLEHPAPCIPASMLYDPFFCPDMKPPPLHHPVAIQFRGTKSPESSPVESLPSPLPLDLQNLSIMPQLSSAPEIKVWQFSSPLDGRAESELLPLSLAKEPRRERSALKRSSERPFVDVHLHHTEDESWLNLRKMPTAHKEICAGCQRPIEDRFLLKVMEYSWHEHCVVCSICHIPLSGTCYQRDRKFYCKSDYDKIYRHPCNGCGMHVGPNELVMRAQGFIYHLQCFVCVECGQPLKQGDYYAIHDGQLFCRMDHEREFMMHMSPKSDDSESYEDCESDGGKHPKRPRTILTTSQRRKFKSAFELNPKPCRKVREQLAAETGLSVRVVQVWFQNQRAKVKKLARRQSQDSNSKNNGSGKNKANDGTKNENCKHEGKKDFKEEEDEQECLKRLGEDESLGSLISESRHHGNVEQISPIPASEYQDTHYGSSMDIGSTVRQTLDDGMTCLEHMFTGEGVTNTAAMENNGVVNPIDKLYSMQSSYFSIE